MTCLPAVAAVGSLYPDRSGTMDMLPYCAGKIKGLGPNAKSGKFWLSSAYTTDYINQAWSATHTTLAQLAADPAFAALWSDSQFVNYLLGTFAFADGQTNQWRINGTPPSYLASVEQEFKDLGSYLLANFTGKNFYLQNWEGDWQLMDNTIPATFVPKSITEAMRAWFRARMAGVRAARDANPGSASTIKCVIEVNRSFDPNRRVVRDVLPYIDVDAVSISAYECINPALTTGNMTAACVSIDALLRQEYALIQQAKPGVEVYVGEYGWPSNETPGWWDFGQAIQQVMTTGNALGMTFACYWEVFDNASPYRGYSLYDQSNVITPAGTEMAVLCA